MSELLGVFARRLEWAQKAYEKLRPFQFREHAAGCRQFDRRPHPYCDCGMGMIVELVKSYPAASPGEPVQEPAKEKP